jgi:hypothetical protein
MNPERLQFLVSAYLDGALLPEEKNELEHALRTSASARTQFWRDAQLHDQLRTVLGESGASFSAATPASAESTSPIEPRNGESPASPAFAPSPWEAPSPWAAPPQGAPLAQGSGRPHPPRGSRLRALLHRPLTALAAGIVLSALCTSALWAYAGQRSSAKAKHLPLLTADFEGLSEIPALGVPNAPNTWSGDYAECTPAQNGVRPRSGKTMLRFLRADNALPPKSAANYVAEAIHVIDLRPLRLELQSGNAQIDIGAWFASADDSRHRHMRFLIKAATFTGTPADAPVLWEEYERACLSSVQRQIEPSATPGEWKPVRVTIPVAQNADFLVFECAAMQVHPRLREGTVEFSGHYLDDVTVHLHDATLPHGMTSHSRGMSSHAQGAPGPQPASAPPAAARSQ